MVLVDTSVWLLALRKDFNTDIKERVDTILSESDVAINGVILLELLGGTKTEKEYNRLKNRLESLFYIDADKLLWENSSKLAFNLRRKGITIPFTDIFIASSAIYAKALLIHADSHFESVAQHAELKTESLLPIIM